MRLIAPGLAALVLFVGGYQTFAQSSTLTIDNWKDPSYSPLARAARLEGEVEVRFRVDETGDTFAVETVSGQPLLANTASQLVKDWHFVVPPSGINPSEVHTTVFTFALTERPEGMSLPQRGEVQVSRDGVDAVKVSASWSNIIVDARCMSADRPNQTPPPLEDAGPGDFIEIARSGCYGSCPSYRVRLFRTGQVEWEGFSYVVHPGVARAIADPDRSAELLTKFISDAFWSLCSSYSQSVTDNSTVLLTASIGGQQKRIEDYAESGPALLHELIREVDLVADSHRWRHGDPAIEPLSNMSGEVWYGKPTMTRLMGAVSNGAADEQVSELIEEGADIDQTDGSGWTALMYAAVHSSNAMQLLLQAQADPDHRDLRGRTPLMAAATGHVFDEELVKAGADVNAQSHEGLTTLMILAAQGNAEEIRLALKANADPLLKDSGGHLALDFLEAANCWRDPLRNPLNEMWSFESDRCDALDKVDFRRASKFLRRAAARKARQRN